MGLLNRATINIVIPFPERDLEFFESVFMRPGRNVTVTLAHPDDAVITRNEEGGLSLTDDTFPSYDAIAKLHPYITQEEYSQSKKLNEFKFNGLVTSYNLDYQEDASIQVTLQLTGTSNSYTDISFLQDINNTPESGSSTLTDPDTGEVVADNVPNDNTPGAEQTTVPDSSPGSLFDDFEAEVDLAFRKKTKGEVNTYVGSGTGTPITGVSLQYRNSAYFHYGPPGLAAGGKNSWYKMVNLGWIINYINKVLINKLENNTEIIFGLAGAGLGVALCKSNYYQYICSANPDNIWIYDSDGINMCKYGDETDASGSFTQVWKKEAAGLLVNNYGISYGFSAINASLPEYIFVNLEVIKKLIDRQKNEDNKFSVSTFLDDLSREVHLQLGGSIDLKLITHPTQDNMLLWYDSNYILSSPNSKSVVPYDFPMFANDPRGSIVRSFNFSAKIPDNVKNLAYVLNQDPENISESDIAPYMNFMYNSLAVTRQRDFNTGQLTITRNVGIQDKLTKLAEIYKAKHEKYVKQLQDAKLAFIKDYENEQKIFKLQQALRHYIQYPTPDIKQSNTLTAPILPFDVTVEIDGINGFRYGDVLEFKGLPERYRTNVVFSIISVTHTVGTDGQWTTKLQCIMRPNITDN
jgi:hypothetical protein